MKFMLIKQIRGDIQIKNGGKNGWKGIIRNYGDSIGEVWVYVVY